MAGVERRVPQRFNKGAFQLHPFGEEGRDLLTISLVQANSKAYQSVKEY